MGRSLRLPGRLPASSALEFWVSTPPTPRRPHEAGGGRLQVHCPGSPDPEQGRPGSSTRVDREWPRNPCIS